MLISAAGRSDNILFCYSCRRKKDASVAPLWASLWLIGAVNKRLREEFNKPQVEINDEKSRMVDLEQGESFGFLERWCACGRRGKMPRHLGPLSDDRLAPDGLRASGRQHPVQHRHADRSRGLLGRKAAGSQPRFDQRLVATHCRFYETTLIVAGGGLPGQSALFGVIIARWRSRRVGRPGSPLATAVERGAITTSMPSPWVAIV